MPDGRYSDLIRVKGFQSLVWTQFLGALNDNLYKQMVSLAAVAAAAAGGSTAQLSLAQGVFILPFFLFSGWAGRVADVVSKRRVLVAAKLFEIGVMTLALVALASGDIGAMLGVLFLMGLQSTFFSPAKFGILPETLPGTQLSRGNGVVQTSTFAAIILGTAAAGFLYVAGGGWMAGLPLLAVAVAGAAASFGIARTAESGAETPFRWNPWAEVVDGVRSLRADRTMWLSLHGTAYFWFIGALLQIIFLLYGTEVLQASEVGVSVMLVALAAGIGAGSMLAGRWSGDKVEIGLVPIGAAGMAAFLMTLAAGAWSYGATLALLLVIGVSAGLFIIPLESLLQQRSQSTERGRVMAAKNFLQTGAVLAASVTSWALLEAAGLSVRQALAVASLLTVAATIYALRTAPEFLIRFALWLATHTVYRIRIEGRENVPARGPALLLCNHVSFVDAFLIGGCIQRFIRFVVYKPYYESKLFKPVLSRMNAIPIQGGDQGCVEQAIARARQELIDGHLVCIFPEGMVTRTGELMPFKRGFERIIEGLDVPIVPIRLDGVWGSLFSFSDGRPFWKRPGRIPRPVRVTFGAPLPPATTAEEARQTILAMGTTQTPQASGARVVSAEAG